MEPVENMLVKITKNGPYLVSGSIPLLRQAIVADEDGESAEEPLKFSVPPTTWRAAPGVAPRAEPRC